MRTFENILRCTDKIIRFALAFLMSLLILDVFWQVIARFLMSRPSSFTEEVARFLLIWISLFGGAYAYRLNSHLGFNLIVKNLSRKNANALFKLCCVLVFTFAVLVMMVGGINLVNMTWMLEQRSPVLNISMAYIYSAIPISGLLFLFYSVCFFFNVPSSSNFPGSK